METFKYRLIISERDARGLDSEFKPGRSDTFRSGYIGVRGMQRASAERLPENILSDLKRTQEAQRKAALDK